MMRYVLIIFAGFGCLLNPSIVWAQPAEVTPKDKELLTIRKEIPALLREHSIPDLALGVAKKGEIIWLEAFGYADRENNINATIQHAFPIGSTAKSFAATGLMTFINDSSVKLTDSINDLILPIELKDIEENTPDIKVWQIMSMTAGISHGYRSYDSRAKVPRFGEREREFYENNAIVAFPPGEVYHYSNTSMGVVQLVTEKLAKNSDYQQVMKQRLFNSLGLKNTYVGFDETKATNFAHIYNSKGKRIENRYYSIPEGGLGFWTSAYDLLRYGMFHAGGITKPAVIDSLNLDRMHTFRDGPADMFGLGWFNFGEGNTEIVSNGNVTGGNAMIYVNIKEELVVVAMVNRTSWDNQANQIVDRVKNVFIQQAGGDGYLQWKRIYGTDYSPRYSLIGDWDGIIKSPETGNTENIRLRFLDNGKVYLFVNNQKYPIEDKTYNLMKDFTGNVDAAIPITGNSGVHNYTLHLNHKDSVIQGYLENNVLGNDYSFRVPLYMKFIKLK